MNQSSSPSSSNVSIPVNLAYERIRYELKYPVSYDQAHQTLKDLEPYLEPDPYGHQGQYVIYSVYFDTRNLTFYHEKIDGFAGRVKFRLRTYLSPKSSMDHLSGSKQFSPVTSSSPWFLETKERVRHYIAKHRLKLTNQQADLFINQHISPGTLEGIVPPHHPIACKLAQVIQYGVLFPTVSVYYHRNAYVFKGARDVRVTLDHNLTALPPKMTTEHLPDILPIHSQNRLLLEFKGNGWMPQEMIDIICRNNLTAQSFSKYCACVEAFQPGLF